MSDYHESHNKNSESSPKDPDVLVVCSTVLRFLVAILALGGAVYAMLLGSRLQLNWEGSFLEAGLSFAIATGLLMVTPWAMVQDKRRRSPGFRTGGQWTTLIMIPILSSTLFLVASASRLGLTSWQVIQLPQMLVLGALVLLTVAAFLDVRAGDLKAAKKREEIQCLEKRIEEQKIGKRQFEAGIKTVVREVSAEVDTIGAVRIELANSQQQIIKTFRTELANTQRRTTRAFRTELYRARVCLPGDLAKSVPWRRRSR